MANPKIVKVVITLEDGTEKTWEGEDAERWSRAADSAFALAFVHGSQPDVGAPTRVVEPAKRKAAK